MNLFDFELYVWIPFAKQNQTTVVEFTFLAVLRLASVGEQVSQILAPEHLEHLFIFTVVMRHCFFLKRIDRDQIRTCVFVCFCTCVWLGCLLTKFEAHFATQRPQIVIILSLLIDLLTFWTSRVVITTTKKKLDAVGDV